MVEKERLDVLGTLATCIAVTDMAYCHPAWQLGDLLLIEYFRDKAVSLDSMKLSVRSHRHDAATLLTPMLKRMQAIISKACSIFNTIDSKNATFVVELVIPMITTLTHS